MWIVSQEAATPAAKPYANHKKNKTKQSIVHSCSALQLSDFENFQYFSLLVYCSE